MSFAAYARVVRREWPGRSAGLVVLKQPESTHLLARRIVREYCSENARVPAVDILAWEQTGGRGREGRRWSSLPGAGIYASLIRSIPGSPSRTAVPLQTAPLQTAPLQTLSLVVATALCETLNVHLENRCFLKWPNDLLVGGRKLAGILIDATSNGGGEKMAGSDDEAVAVISFGVNHGRDVAEPGATSMELETPGATSLAGLAAQLVGVSTAPSGAK